MIGCRAQAAAILDVHLSLDSGNPGCDSCYVNALRSLSLSLSLSLFLFSLSLCLSFSFFSSFSLSLFLSFSLSRFLSHTLTPSISASGCQVILLARIPTISAAPGRFLSPHMRERSRSESSCTCARYRGSPPSTSSLCTDKMRKPQLRAMVKLPACKCETKDGWQKSLRRKSVCPRQGVLMASPLRT